MEIVFDPVKDRGNRKKHGVSLAEAVELDWDAMLVMEDDRHQEERWIGIAPRPGKGLYTVVFTVRGQTVDVMRIISLRRAINPEIRRNETQNR